MFMLVCFMPCLNGDVATINVKSGPFPWIVALATAYPVLEGVKVGASCSPGSEQPLQELSQTVHVGSLAARVSVLKQFRCQPGELVRARGLSVDLTAANPPG
ncbi:hypothetical protein E2C01_011316 [Portunus trituberculatus]|uniref:Uncharacterized protein n=1 Tax=Portunus trituberculatus TaxID=210409 RepID=A0A5B7DAQ7_PORTR|nr:hypothetical protein [Portunus trituberculatus]